MIIRSVVLFTHVIGMLLLFMGIAFEWLSLKALRRATTSGHASSWAGLQGMLPRVSGIALATILVSGVLLARRIGAFELAWVRLALGLLVLIGIFGSIVQSRVRALRDTAGHDGEVGLDALRVASTRWLASLFMRAAMGLAAVYLMIGKPPLSTSLIVTGVAVGTGLAAGLLTTVSRRSTFGGTDKA